MPEQTIQKTLGMPLNLWIGFAGVFVGAVISLCGVILTNRSSLNRLRMQLAHEQKARAQETEKERLEELYVLVGHWLKAMYRDYLNISRAMREEPAGERYLKQVVADSKKRNYDFTRLEMIFDVYAHSLKPSYEKILEVIEKSKEALTQYVGEYTNAYEDKEKFIKPYTEANLEIIRLGKALKEEIDEYVKNV